MNITNVSFGKHFVNVGINDLAKTISNIYVGGNRISNVFVGDENSIARSASDLSYIISTPYEQAFIGSSVSFFDKILYLGQWGSSSTDGAYHIIKACLSKDYVFEPYLNFDYTTYGNCYYYPPSTIAFNGDFGFFSQRTPLKSDMRFRKVYSDFRTEDITSLPVTKQIKVRCFSNINNKYLFCGGYEYDYSDDYNTDSDDIIIYDVDTLTRISENLPTTQSRYCYISRLGKGVVHRPNIFTGYYCYYVDENLVSTQITLPMYMNWGMENANFISSENGVLGDAKYAVMSRPSTRIEGDNGTSFDQVDYTRVGLLNKDLTAWDIPYPKPSWTDGSYEYNTKNGRDPNVPVGNVLLFGPLTLNSKSSNSTYWWDTNSDLVITIDSNLTSSYYKICKEKSYKSDINAFVGSNVVIINGGVGPNPKRIEALRINK